MPVGKPGSCFLDAAELALGVPSVVVRAFIYHHFPDADCDNKGYHPTLLNIAMLELYKIGVTQIDAQPTDVDPETGETVRRPGHENVVERLTQWFRRPGFRCVVTGPKADGNEHANAWNGQHWIDPANPETPIDEPNVNIRSIWVCTLPPAVSHAQSMDAEEDNDGGSKIDQT